MENVIPWRWLTRPVPQPDAIEEKHLYSVTAPWFLREHPGLSPGEKLPFGLCYIDWVALKRQLQPGDELWEYDSRIEPGNVPEVSGIVLLREGCIPAQVELHQHHDQFDWRLEDMAFLPTPGSGDYDDGTGLPLVFTYFQGLPAEIHRFEETPGPCALCGRVAKGFALDYADCPELCPEPYRQSTDQRGGKHGCCLCLGAGRFGFSHDTELGLVTEIGLVDFEEIETPLQPEGFRMEAIPELHRTPEYSSAQQALWLVHCNDFMVFQGTWDPAHFFRHAPDGDGKALFLQIAGPDWANCWDIGPSRIFGGYSPYAWGDAQCYVFECRHCRVRRAHFDWY